LCNSRRRRGGGFISLDEIAVLDATVAGDAAAVEDLRNAFGFSDADGNGLSTTKLMHVL
jgi:calcium-binding protein CML